MKIPSVLLTLPILICLAAVPCVSKADPVSDLRLLKPVSISPQVLSVGRLLKLVSRADGVQLNMDDNSPSSGVQVMVSLHNVELLKFMYALSSLLGNKLAPWHWTSYGSIKEHSYWLQSSSSSSDYASEMSALLKGNYLQLVKYAIQIANLSPAKRGESLHKEITSGKLDRWLYSTAFSDSQTWPVLSCLKEHYSPDDLVSFLNGSSSITIPASDFTNKYRMHFQKEYSSPGRPPDIFTKMVLTMHGTSEDDLSLHPYVIYEQYNQKRIDDKGEILSCQMTSNELLKSVHSLWMLKGDTERDAAGNSTITDYKIHQNERKALNGFLSRNQKTVFQFLNKGENFSTDIDGAIYQLANCSQVSMMALESAYGQEALMSVQPRSRNLPAWTLNQYIASNESGPLSLPLMIHKWHDHILLIQYGSSYLNLVYSIPYNKRKLILRDAANVNYPIQDLLTVLHRLNTGQRKEANEILAQTPFGGIIRFLWIMEAFPEVINPGGIEITPQMVQYLRSSEPSENWELLLEHKLRVRIRFEDPRLIVSSLNGAVEQKRTRLETMGMSGIWK